MKNSVRFIASASMLIVGLMPIAALADDGEIEASSSVRVGTTDSGTNARTDEMDQADTEEHHGDVEAEASTSSHEGDHESLAGDEHENDNSQSDENDNEIEIDHESADEATSTVDKPEDVHDHGQLRSFLNHVLKEDQNISDVHVSSTTIETDYDLPAKFLWAIPAHLNVSIVVNSDGSVQVTYPWYAFLFSKKSDLDSKLSQAAASSTAASSTASVSLQASLIEAILSVLKG